MIDQKRYEYRGQPMTISELAELAGVKWSTLYNRIHVSKLSVEDAVHLRFRGNGRPDRAPKHLFRGEFKTVKEIAALIGRCPKWVRANLSNLERNTSGPTYTHGAITDTLTGWSHRTGISRTTLTMRLKAGWSIERVLTEAAEYGRPKYKPARNLGARP